MPITWPVVKQVKDAGRSKASNTSRKPDEAANDPEINVFSESEDDEELDYEPSIHITVHKSETDKTCANKGTFQDSVVGKDMEELVQSTSGVDEQDTPITMHSFSDGEDVLADSLPEECVSTEQVDESIAPLEEPVLRRSTRERREPNWLQSGDYVINQHNVSSKFQDWEKRCLS